MLFVRCASNARKKRNIEKNIHELGCFSVSQFGIYLRCLRFLPVTIGAATFFCLHRIFIRLNETGGNLQISFFTPSETLCFLRDDDIQKIFVVAC